MFVSSKRYGAERGLAVAYRQYKAESHCRFIHGYAMEFYFEFETPELDARNWCIDYGSLRPLKEFLEDQFDHKLIVATDDPKMEEFLRLDKIGLAQVREVERTGCEGLSKSMYEYVNEIFLPTYGRWDVHCRKVEVRETPCNAAWYEMKWEDSVACWFLNHVADFTKNFKENEPDTFMTDDMIRVEAEVSAKIAFAQGLCPVSLSDIDDID